MLIHEITLRNILSFGPDTPMLPLHNLNVLIGPNGSGKSNLIEALTILRYAPSELAKPIREGGGVHDWIWKGAPDSEASVDAVVDVKWPLRHVIKFAEYSQSFELRDERVENREPQKGKEQTYFYYRFLKGFPVLNVKEVERKLQREDVQLNESILSQRKDPDQYPEITHLARSYERMRFYRDWPFGRQALLRRPQAADQPNDFLAEDFRNLGLVLSNLRRDSNAKERILTHLRDLYDGIRDCDVIIEGGTVQVFFHEDNLASAVPATRLSDGTLRYLCLLAILCHPKPPPLVCIEEPELGLHPDILPKIAELLKDASQRMQLVVTTHSNILVDELSDQPESVIVCEKENGCTTMRRLEEEPLKAWLEKYALGQLWTKGEIGGTRW